MTRDRSEYSEVTVAIKPFFISSFTGWPIAVVAALVGRAAAVGAPISSMEYAAWLFLGCAPGAVALMIVRGLPSRSIAEVLYDAEHSGR